jgi:NADPH:quinone reductase-like Zn-dependent oxidoreductase
MKPSQMLAVRQSVGGGPEVLKLVTTQAPAPGPTEILVRVKAAGVNPTDWKTRARGRFPIGVEPPFILGYDVSGVVEAVGEGVTIWAPGDEVFGMPRFPHPAGAYAEYVAAPSRHFAAKPPELDHVSAAGLPLAGLTAWQALVDTAKLLPGQKVLVHAAAGGVGHLAVQIAKARGAHVIGTASATKHKFLHQLGVDQAIDYISRDFTEDLPMVDVVLDPIGGCTTLRSLKVLKPGGLLVRLPPMTDDTMLSRATELGVRALRLLVEPDRQGLQGLAELVTAERLHVAVDSIFPLSEAAAAHRRGETGHATGKIILVVST